MYSNLSTVAPQVNDVVPRWQHSWTFFKSQLKIWSTVDPQIPICCLHACTAHLWLVTYLCEQTWNIMYDACQQVTLFHFWIHILTLQLFYAVGHNHSAHLVTLCGTSVQICQGALFSFMDFHLWMRSLTWYLCVKWMHTSYACTPISW